MTRLFACLCACLMVALAGCGSAQSPTAPSVMVADVAGEWDVVFDGTIVERNDGGPIGDSQHDEFVFRLQQSGTAVTGQILWHEGRPDETAVPLTGTVTDSRFAYRVNFSPGDCAVSITAETTLSGAATTFTGRQIQSNCEGRAEGRVNGTKR